MTKRRQAAKAAAFALAIGLWAAPAVAGPADLYYERTLMSAAHGRCGLFTPRVARALDAGATQARGAALRAGVAEAELNRVRTRARNRAAATACDSRDLETAAGRVRQAFEGWARTARMSFPDDHGAWQVDRRAYRTSTWLMRQTRGSGGNAVVFGYAGNEAGHSLALTAVGTWGRRLASARILVRDPGRSAVAWVPRFGVAATPPRSAMRAYVANAQAAAQETLAPGGRDDARLFRFPATAGEALARLDPRERFLVELVHSDGSVRTMTLGVGDFAAAQAFLAMGTL